MSTKWKKDQPTEKGKALNPYIKYSSIAIQMGLVIGAGSWLGDYLDEKQGNELPIFTIVLSLISIAIALYLILKDVLKPKS